MFPNLRAEMARYGIKPKDIAKVIGVSDKSVNNKISGRTPITLEEAQKIRERFFPKMSLDILFSKTIAQDYKVS